MLSTQNIDRDKSSSKNKQALKTKFWIAIKLTPKISLQISSSEAAKTSEYRRCLTVVFNSRIRSVPLVTFS